MPALEARVLRPLNSGVSWHMKALLLALMALAMTGVVVANSVHPIKLKQSSSRLASGQIRVTKSGSYRDFALTLSITLSSDKKSLEALEGQVGSRKFVLDVNTLGKIDSFRLDKVQMYTDCCVYGMTVNWGIPYGEPRRCMVETDRGRRMKSVRNMIFIRVPSDKEAEMHLSDACE